MEENNTSTDKNTLTALIDYENCGSLKNISLEQYGELIIFVGPQQNVVVGVSLDIENYCTLRLFFDLVDLNWSQTTKLT